MIESFVSAGYDPSVTFTGVDDERIFNNHLLTIVPNPVDKSRSITVEAGIPSNGYIDLTLYDVLGNKVANIYSGESEIGLSKFNVSIDESLPSGIYFVTLNGNGFICTEKLIIQ